MVTNAPRKKPRGGHLSLQASLEGRHQQASEKESTGYIQPQDTGQTEFLMGRSVIHRSPPSPLCTVVVVVMVVPVYGRRANCPPRADRWCLRARGVKWKRHEGDKKTDLSLLSPSRLWTCVKERETGRACWRISLSLSVSLEFRARVGCVSLLQAPSGTKREREGQGTLAGTACHNKPAK